MVVIPRVTSHFSLCRDVACFASHTVIIPQTFTNYQFVMSGNQLQSCCFLPGSGLKYKGISIRQKSGEKQKKGRCQNLVVHVSLLGVGAPEALVIGVVALMVFGPQGLAEVARTLGKTLRAFRPTIRELQEVSREFKTTLEREIGLDDDPHSKTDTPIISSMKQKPLVQVNLSSKNKPRGETPGSEARASEELLTQNVQQDPDHSLQQRVEMPKPLPGDHQTDTITMESTSLVQLAKEQGSM